MSNKKVNEKINPIGLHIGKIRLEQLNCRRCGKLITKGSNCLFTRWTWAKYCLDCGKNMINERVENKKDEIKYYKKLSKKLGNFRLVKENMCASLRN